MVTRERVLVVMEGKVWGSKVINPVRVEVSGPTVGVWLGLLGIAVGTFDGAALGCAVGQTVGRLDGLTLGVAVGSVLGTVVGVQLGIVVGIDDGVMVGDTVTGATAMTKFNTPYPASTKCY